MKFQLSLKDTEGNSVVQWDGAYIFDSQEQGQAWIAEKFENGSFAEGQIASLVDVSAQYDQATQIDIRRKKQEVGANVIALVAVINDSKNYGLSDFQAMLSDSTLTMIKELLYAGALISAKQMIAAFDSQWFTDADKALLIEIIDNSGLAV